MTRWRTLHGGGRAAVAGALLLIGFAAFANRPAAYARPCSPSGDVVAVFSRDGEIEQVAQFVQEHKPLAVIR